MKNATIALFLLLASFRLSAQDVFANQTTSALEKVLRDFPNQFKNIKGALIIQNPQAIDYESNIRIPGSLSCIVTRHNSGKKEVVSWKADLFEFEEFGQAFSKYKELFGQIKNTIIKVEGEKPYILNGHFKNPEESKRFHSILFQLIPSTGQLQNVKVELVMQYQMPLWKLAILVYDRDRADDEKGFIIEQ